LRDFLALSLRYCVNDFQFLRLSVLALKKEIAKNFLKLA